MTLSFRRILERAICWTKPAHNWPNARVTNRTRAGLFRTFIMNSAMLLLAFLFWIIYVFIEFQFISWIVLKENFVQVNGTRVFVSVYYEILVLTLFYPLLEEIVFRLPLRLTPLNLQLATAITIWFYLFYTDFFAPGFRPWLSWIIIIPLIVVLIHLHRVPQRLLGIHAAFENRLLHPLAMVSAFSFAMAHFGKISFDSLFYGLLYVFVVYFILGLFLAYVRIRFGILVSLFFHSLHNSLPYFVLLYYYLKKGYNIFG